MDALSNNPTDSIYQPGAALTPDQQRELVTVTVTGQRIHAGEDAGLDLWYALNQQRCR